MKWLLRADRPGVRAGYHRCEQALKLFDHVLTLMNEPRSAYEHYQTTTVLHMMLPHLPTADKTRLKDAVRLHRRAWYDTDGQHVSKEWEHFYDQIILPG